LALFDAPGIGLGHVVSPSVSLFDRSEATVVVTTVTAVVTTVTAVATIVSANENVVLSSLLESVVGVVDGCALGVSLLGHVVSLLLHPVHGDLGSGYALLSVVASLRDSCSSKVYGLGVGSDVGDVAHKGGHVHLVGTSDGLVDPEPSAHALSVRASGEVGDLEVLELSGGAVVYNREDDKVAWLDLVLVALVRDSPSATGYVFARGSVHVAPAIVLVGPWDRCVTGVRTESLAHAGLGFVGGDLTISVAIGWQLEDRSVGRRGVKVSVPPPIGERELLKRLRVPVRVRVGAVSIESRGMPQRQMSRCYSDRSE